MTGSQLSNHHGKNADLAGELITLYAEAINRAAKQKQDVEVQLKAILEELSKVYLPRLDPTALADVAKRAGFKKLQRRDPIAAMAHETEVLRKRIAAVEADTQYQRREWLVGTNGELTRKLEETTSLLKPWEESCEKFECLNHFELLVDLGYDTPEYKVAFYEARYWTYWAAGDEICTALGMDDFGDDVLPAYRAARTERDRWRELQQSDNDAIQAVHDLVREHDRSVARIPQLPQLYLAASQKSLAEFLALADAVLLNQWNAAHSDPERAITMGLQQLAGMRAKIESLEDLSRGLTPALAEFRERQAKYRRKAAKFARPKHRSRRHSDFFADHKFAQKKAKYVDRVRKAESQSRKIVAYNEYSTFDLEDNDPELWFRHMAGGRPSRMYPQTRSWYDRNPSARPSRTVDDNAQRVAQAASATQGDDLGYIS